MQALIAGTHGLEVAPILALHRVRRDLDPKALRGTVILVHIANLPSYLKRTVYYNPWDWKNLNRVYPGRPDGTVTERIAHAITTEVIARADYLVDMHSGDGNENLLAYNYWNRLGLDPRVDSIGREMAQAWGNYGIVVDTLKKVPSISETIDWARALILLHPEGLDHGGHTGAEQGRIDAELLRAIHDADLAGGIVFAWVDEWFKRNWAVADRVVPSERNRLWLNALNPEQHYGLIAALPGAEGPPVVLDGRSGDWQGVAPIYDRPATEPGRLRQLRATSDEGWLYLLLVLAGDEGPIDWEREAFWIGIDTYGAAAGDHARIITL